MLDDRDRRLLEILQRDAETPVGALADALHLSPSACSRRVARLREAGYIRGTAAVVDQGRLGLRTTIFALVRTTRHDAEWLERFRAALADIREVVEVHRLTGNFDYILKIVLPNVEHYDSVYKRILARIDLHEISAYISMETLKAEAVLPSSFA